MRLFVAVVAAAAALTGAPGFADDADLIALAAFDYIDGWYEADPVRMERALHPELAKRIIHKGDNRDRLEHMGAMALVQAARAGGGKNVAPERRVKEVVILDVENDVASVKAIMHGWIDYLHMAKVDGRWVIVNVLWRLHQESD